GRWRCGHLGLWVRGVQEGVPMRDVSMLATTDNSALIRAVLESLVQRGNPRPLLEILADDVVFRMTVPDGIAATEQGGGKRAIRHYFRDLGALITFWRVGQVRGGARVVAEIEESFTIEPGGLAGHSELTLVFDLRDSLITGLSIGEAAAEPVAA